jgi:hypothetical protein
MTTVTLYKCDNCDKIIQKPDDGVVIQGNIYVADPQTRGGLIGNNFPEPNSNLSVPPKTFTQDDVKESVYCIPCFMNAIDIKVKTIRTGP